MSWIYRLGDSVRDRARRRQWTGEQAAGRRGEDLAHRYLRRNGFVIVARNYRTATGSGEIDLVAWERDTLAFVEVKSRASEDFGPPDRAVDAEKRRHLERSARDYTRRTGIGWNCVRFDIVNVILAEPPRIELLRDAFGAL